MTLRTFFQDFKTKNDIPVTVEYAYERGGECAYIKECWREPEVPGDVAIDIPLTDKEHERFAAWIMEHRHWTDHADDNDD